MKRVFAFVLMLTLVLSCGVVAFAAKSPSVSGDGKQDIVLEVCNKEDKVIDVVPKEKIVYAKIGQAGLLPQADKDAFKAANKDVKKIDDKVVKDFFWLNTKNYEEPEDFAYYKWNFTCAGENVTVTVNGKDMEVVHVDGIKYFAKLTELGAVAICCDK